MRWCVLVCWAAIGCGGSGGATETVASRLSRPVSVDELLAMWATNAGAVRDCEGKLITLHGRQGEVEYPPGVRCASEVLAEATPGALIIAYSNEANAIPDNLRVEVRGRLYAEGSRVVLRDAVINRR